MEVVNLKKVFFPQRDANYDACLEGRIQLVSEENAAEHLKRDFQQMCDAGMFFRDPPSWQEIMERLENLETEINKLVF